MKKTAKSPAKVNFLLKIVGRRADGYHELNSIFQKISLYDTLAFRITDAPVIKLHCDRADVPADENNLVVQAAIALRRSAGVEAGVDIRLEKSIPVSAGLGGGSGNAATTLAILNGMWGINYPASRLMEIGLGVGADVPFFLGGPLAWVEGIGEKISPLDAVASLPLLIIKPEFGVSTARAYNESTFDFAPCEQRAETIDDLRSGEPARIATRLHNDLEPWALKNYPELAQLKDKILMTPPYPLGVSMSGSGPAMLAIYHDVNQRNQAAKTLKNIAPFVTPVSTLAT